MSSNRPEGRSRWTSLQFAYLALALNGLGVAVLFANLLIGGNTAVAVTIAAVFLVLGFATGFQTRRLRIREAGERRR